MPILSPSLVIAATLALAPYLAAAFFARRVEGSARALPAWAQVFAPSMLCVPYLLVALGAGIFRWSWLAVYALIPVAIAALLRSRADEPEKSLWRHFLILALLGLAVDLRWFERAWPPHMAIFSKVLLLDAGLYGFFALHPIAGAGFDLRLRRRDFVTGLREFSFYLPIALALGLSLGFLHLHGFGSAVAPVLGRFSLAWIFTFLFIAVPEELFFRAWLQNLLERKLGRTGALIVASILFGLSHFNKRAVYFNWRYVLLAAIAGIFYGRAWRRDRRVGASAITHATVDAVWSLWLR